MYLLSVTGCILFYLFIFLIQWLINPVSDCHGREIENSRLVFSNPWFDNKASALQLEQGGVPVRCSCWDDNMDVTFFSFLPVQQYPREMFA